MQVDEKELREILVEVDRLREQVTHLQGHNSELVEARRAVEKELTDKLELTKAQANACGSVMLELQQECVELRLELEKISIGVEYVHGETDLEEARRKWLDEIKDKPIEEVRELYVAALMNWADALHERDTLQKDLNRFKKGEVTPEEVHEMCHNLQETVSLEQFAEGCRAYQIKLYGKSIP